MKKPDFQEMRYMLAENTPDDLKKYYMQLSNDDTMYEFLKEYNHHKIPLMMIKNATLIEYPDEELFEDGELSDDLKYEKKFLISEVEKKIVLLWRHNKIVIAKWEDLK